MKIFDVSYHGSHYDLSPEEYLIKSESNIRYASYLKNNYSLLFIFHTSSNKKIKEKGITYFFRKKKWNSKVLLPLKLSWIVRKNCPDIILVHSIFYIHFAAFLRFFIPDKAVILIQNHGELPPVSYLKKVLIRYCDKYIDGYLFTSKQMGRPWLNQKLIATDTKIFEVMEGSTSFVKKDRINSKEITGVSLTKPVFLWVGRLDSNKDPLCVLKAFKRFKDTGKDFELYMFYHTIELLNEIEVFISDNDLQKNIFLKGYINHDALEKWYNATDYYISASHKEGSGYALCEAMACGAIPIVSKIPSFEYMTKNGYAGLLYEKGNSDMLFENLLTTIGLDQKEYQNRVNQIFQERLSFEAIAKGLDSIIQKHLEERISCK